MRKNIGKYYVSMNQYGVVSAGLIGGMVYYTWAAKDITAAKKIFKSVCKDVANW